MSLFGQFHRAFAVGVPGQPDQCPDMVGIRLEDLAEQRRRKPRVVKRRRRRQLISRLRRIETMAMERDLVGGLGSESIHRQLIGLVVLPQAPLQARRGETQGRLHGLDATRTVVDRAQHRAEFAGVAAAIGCLGMMHEPNQRPGDPVGVGHLVIAHAQTEPLTDDVGNGDARIHQGAAKIVVGYATDHRHAVGFHGERRQVGRKTFLVPDRQVERGPAADEVVHVFVIHVAEQVAAPTVGSRNQQTLIQRRSGKARHRGAVERRIEIPGPGEHQQLERGGRDVAPSGKQRRRRRAKSV